MSYRSGCPSRFDDPKGALGVSDWADTGGDTPKMVFLGSGGSIELGFTNNLLTNSGDEKDDIYVFEVDVVEPVSLGIRPADAYTLAQLQTLAITDNDGDGFYVIAEIGPLGLGFDLDMVMPGYEAGNLRFNAIHLTDVLNAGCDANSPGSDIDAVCALSFIPYDCKGVLNGNAEIDDCGACLLPNDPAFNNCVEKHTLFIPNAFSPNEDGINDRFVIFSDQEIVKQVRHLAILNRWGQELYRASSFNPNAFDQWWDGTYRSNTVSDGVYT